VTAEIASLKSQAEHIEVKREEARIDGNIGRLQSESLKTELSFGDLQFRCSAVGSSS
jgi:polysaccharide biosynthesis/export protein